VPIGSLPLLAELFLAPGFALAAQPEDLFIEFLVSERLADAQETVETSFEQLHFLTQFIALTLKRPEPTLYERTNFLLFQLEESDPLPERAYAFPPLQIVEFQSYPIENRQRCWKKFSHTSSSIIRTFHNRSILVRPIS
jgi:hypothetical protein